MEIWETGGNTTTPPTTACDRQLIRNFSPYLLPVPTDASSVLLVGTTRRDTTHDRQEQTVTENSAGMGDMLPILKQSLRQQIEQSNALVAQIAAASGDADSMLTSIRDDIPTEDANILKFRKMIADIENKKRAAYESIHEYIKAHALPSSEGVDVDALKEQHKKLVDSVKSGRNFAQNLPNFDADTFNAELPDIKTLRGTSVKAGESSGRSGGKKPRFEMAYLSDGGPNENIDGYKPVFKEVKNDKDGTTRKASNFTILAAELSSRSGHKVNATELQEQALAEAKVPDLNSLNGAAFSFPMFFGTGENQKHYWIKIQTKSV